jgi:hypothetical protein
MLKKDICVRCHDESRVRKWARQPAKERSWARGRLACVAQMDRDGSVWRWAKVAGAVPDCCYYYLEQLL